MFDFTDINDSIHADCPYCSRSESFGEPAGARAWLTEHILQAHGDELPAYK